MKLHIPSDYQAKLGSRDTQRCIQEIKDGFQKFLSTKLRLERASAPIFFRRGTGINEDGNGRERKLLFQAGALNDATMEVVISLAKWKRMMLAKEKIEPGAGIWTDMNAIRPDVELDNIHSMYVDQWDWEKTITREDRNPEFLMATVKKIFEAMKMTENEILDQFGLTPALVERVTFITAEELERRYPDKSRKEREELIAAQYKAVFLMNIGWNLSDGQPHERRAPDFDDWNLNGDLIVWNPVLGRAMELSSMGIRVDQESLVKQLEEWKAKERLELKFHKMLMNGEFPLSIGGGIGQSRLCMLLLHKAHIGEVQASEWPEEMILKLEAAGIQLLSTA